MTRHHFTPIYIQNKLSRFSKLTHPYIRFQYVQAMKRICSTDLAFFFSTDINVGMTQWPANWFNPPKRIYVGFTQDGAWSQKKIDRLSRAMNSLDAVTVFSEEERLLYISRYGLDANKVHFIHIHTDETGDYSQYPDDRPIHEPYVLSLGSPNRRFTPIARACHDLKIPLVIVTRPWHKNDSLDEVAELGATIVTDADKMKALTYLKHAQFMVMAFQTDELPGAFTTLIHGMFMGTPSIVTSCLGIRDYVIHGESGLVTPHNDESSLKSAIGQLWNDSDLIDRFTTTGHERAQQYHSLDSAAVRFESLAEMVLKD